MNMTGINPAAAGGPVGGGMMMMSNGSSPAMANNNSNTTENLKPLLNTYIYEYLLKNGHYDIARALVKDDKWDMRTIPKQSPGRRKDGEVNGADGDGMDMDIKDDIPDDLPRPHNLNNNNAGQDSLGFLLEWFAIFSDLFAAHRSQRVQGANMTPATQYLLQHHQLQRMRESQQNQNLARPGMMNSHMAAMRANQLRNGMVNGDMSKRMTPQQMSMLSQQQQQQKAAMQQQMARGEQGDGDPNARPATPADGENGGSPSKRPRLEGQQFNGAMMPNGRPGVPNAGQQNMMIQAPFNANMNQPRFQQNGAIPPKMPGAMTNGMMNMPTSGSPMMQAMNFGAEGMPADMYNNRMAGQVMQGPNGQSGNHALQDYQMQLMLLEQQNKKRLMMARQEQHENQPRDGQSMPGGVNMAPGTSPSGSRSGTSPNPTDQMKRIPQMGGMPGSPSAGDMQGRSPAGMNFMNGGIGQNFDPTMFMKENPGMMVQGGPGMRPPTSVDMNAMNRQQQQQQARMASQFQGGQPMQQQQSQGQPQPVGTPGQRNEMPPPSAPPTGNSATRNNQPASPANSNAPPTPSQTNKPNPKSKKGKDDATKKRPQKKNSVANAPAEENPPATPTSSTPITPVHVNNTFNGNAGKGPGQVPHGGQQNQQVQGMQPNSQPMPAPDLGQNNGFGDFSAPDQNFNLDFSTLENTDVLENFDFDSFLNTSGDDAFTFDGGMGVENFSMDGPGE